MTPEEFQKAVSLNDDVMAKLLKFDAFFVETAAIHNLVARSTLPDRWSRHYLDSAQLAALIPQGPTSILDLGSGAGFPGLILAAIGEEFGWQLELVESTGKKALFLREAASIMGLQNVNVHQSRIETLSPKALKKSADIITARALANLNALLTLSAPFLSPHTHCVFPKGERGGEELTIAQEHWHMNVREFPSMTSDASVLFVIDDVTQKPGAGLGQAAKKQNSPAKQSVRPTQ